MADMSAFAKEMWAWYALTVMIVAARLLSRRLLFKSFRALQADDWLMCFTILVHTALLVIVWIQTYTPTNLVNPADNLVLTPEDIKLREYGSKLVLVTEHLQMVVIWCVKGCLLIMYSRLTLSLKQNLMVKIVAGYVIFGFVLMEILWFTWCRPFHNYWKVPPPNLNCSAETNHMITNAVLNISSDIMIILLPMPLLIQSSLPIKRKIILCAVFALGIFTILAAALSKYYSLGSPYGTEWIFWYIREVSTAIITANLPLTWTLWQAIFGIGAFYSSKYGKSSNPRTGEATGGSRFRSTYGNLTSRDERTRRRADPYEIDVSPSESQEQINGQTGVPLKIWQHSEVLVTAEQVHAKDSASDGSTSPQQTPTRQNTVSRPGYHSPTGSIHGDASAKDAEMGIVTKVSGDWATNRDFFNTASSTTNYKHFTPVTAEPLVIASTTKLHQAAISTMAAPLEDLRDAVDRCVLLFSGTKTLINNTYHVLEKQESLRTHYAFDQCSELLDGLSIVLGLLMDEVGIWNGKEDAAMISFFQLVRSFEKA
ncbi:hypothetical protein HJFPF1_05551 [Paramyrothecium foliicola]|nr:hypothetical protein HJFPF1_05551 [Paramyrothecium foliicola]